jgi:hypothetical protein
MNPMPEFDELIIRLFERTMKGHKIAAFFVAGLVQRYIVYEHEASDWYTASSNHPIEPLRCDGDSDFDHFLIFKAVEQANLFETTWCCDAEDRHEIVNLAAPRVSPDAFLDALRKRAHATNQSTIPALSS